MSDGKITLKVIYVDPPQKWDFAQDPEQLHYPFYVQVPGIENLQKFSTTRKVVSGDLVSFKPVLKLVYMKNKDEYKAKYIVALVPEVI